MAQARRFPNLISSVIFPLQEKLKGHTTVADRRALEQSQWWSPERLEAHRVERLRSLLVRAASHVPYYRDLFARIGFDPASVASTVDLQRLPFLDKPLIREHTEALKADDARGLVRFNTGGSSGVPLIFFIGSERVSRDVAAKWRATRWWGVDIGDPEVVLWGSPIELGSQDRIRRWRDALMRTRLFPAFEMSDRKVADFIEQFRAMRPRMLFGYPSAFAHIARYAQRTGERLDDLGIKVVFVTSERLYDHQRALIEQVFGAPVANGYGGRDAGFIAHQCPHGSMHITAEDIIVEIVDAHGRVLPPGQSGEIVVTHLATGDFPFIRYRTGDVGTLGEQLCGCGRTLPVLQKIEGRSTDFIVAQDGTVMHGLALIYVVRDMPGVSAFRIEQESLELTRVRIVTDDDFPQDGDERIRAGMQARLGSAVDVVVEHVDQIPAEGSGKFRYVISKVKT
ncbi:MAG: AMP-binding protein [Methyloversatilis sp.]|nr:AMP-binding protein [Methyloversatilis sp.]